MENLTDYFFPSKKYSRSKSEEKNVDPQFTYLRNHSQYSEGLYLECLIMLKYAAKKGFHTKEWIDNHFIRIEDLVKESTKLESELNQHEDSTEEKNELKARLEGNKQALEQEIILLPKIHAILLEHVSPATPKSIWLTQPDASGYLHIPPITFLRICALVCLAPFILFTTIRSGNTNEMEVYRTIAIIFGAGLGSAFYALFTANHYVTARTFDLGYSSVYTTRWILGIIAGVILANIIVPYVKSDGMKPDFLAQLGPPMIAMIGGYSAEAVNQILRKLVTMLVTLFESETQDIVRFKEQEMKVKYTAEDTKKRLSTAIELTKIYGEFQSSVEAKPDTGNKIKELLNNLIGGLDIEQINHNESKDENTKLQSQIVELQAKIKELQTVKPVEQPNNTEHTPDSLDLPDKNS